MSMDNGIYIALSRQAGMFRLMDTIAHNIANSGTTGYQSEQMMFTDYMVTDGNRHNMSFTQDIATYRDTTEGPIRQTGNTFDLAINGNGYFMVRTPLGDRYTRSGGFQIDETGSLITAEGYQVLSGDGQPIEFEPQDRDITFADNGEVYTNQGLRGQVGVVKFANPQVMEHLAGGLFKADVDPEEAVAFTDYRLVQGAIEDSNVQPVLEMTRMITTMRTVTNTSKYIDSMYELQRRASSVYAKA